MITGTAPSARRLGGKILVAAAGNAVNALLTWLLLVVLARQGTPEDLGVYAFATAIIVPIFILTNLSLLHLQVTDVRDRYPVGTYLVFRLTTNCVALLIIGATVGVLGRSFDVIGAVVAIGVARALDATSDVFHGVLQKTESVGRYALSLVSRSAASLVLFGALLALTGDLMIAAMGLIAASLCVLLCIDLPSARRVLDGRGSATASFALHWDAAAAREIVRVGLPLTAGLFFIGMAPNLPRLVLEYVHDAHTLGLYAALGHLTQLSRQVIAAAGIVVCPRLAGLYQTGDRSSFKRLAAVYLACSCGVGALGAVAASLGGRTVLHYLYGPVYAEEASSLTIVMLADAMIGVGAALGVILTSARLFRRLWLYHGGALVLTALASVTLVGPYGVRGAALALLVLGCAMVVLQTWRLWPLLSASVYPLESRVPPGLSPQPRAAAAVAASHHAGR